MILASASSSTSGAVMDGDEVAGRRVEFRQLVLRQVVRDLGATRWASPPPGISWRTVALLVLLGDLGLLLLAMDVGLIHP